MPQRDREIETETDRQRQTEKEREKRRQRQRQRQRAHWMMKLFINSISCPTRTPLLSLVYQNQDLGLVMKY